MDNVNINKFETTSNKTIVSYAKLITSKVKTNKQIHNIEVVATPTNIKVIEDGEEFLNVNLEYSNHIGENFGLISSYLQHSCSKLSKIQFSQIEITTEDYKIEVLNTNLEDKPIPGGYFELKNEKGELLKEGQTDGKAIFGISGLQEGIYTVQQKIAPDGYILNDEILKFKVTSEGKVIFNCIKYGNYTYKQLQVPDGYVLNKEEYTVNIKEDGTVTFNEKIKE